MDTGHFQLQKEICFSPMNESFDFSAPFLQDVGYHGSGSVGDDDGQRPPRNLLLLATSAEVPHDVGAAVHALSHLSVGRGKHIK